MDGNAVTVEKLQRKQHKSQSQDTFIVNFCIDNETSKEWKLSAQNQYNKSFPSNLCVDNSFAVQCLKMQWVMFTECPVTSLTFEKD